MKLFLDKDKVRHEMKATLGSKRFQSKCGRKTDVPGKHVTGGPLPVTCLDCINTREPAEKSEPLYFSW